jgi:hypothetical protein
MTTRPKLRAFVAVSLASVLALVVIAGIRFLPGIETPDPSSAPNVSPGSAAMRATVNPETGELEVRAGGPPLSLDPATQEAMRRDDEGLEQVLHPDGSVSVDLKGRFQSASVARIGKDGKPVICTEHADDVEAVLQGAAPRSAKKVDVQ